MRPVETVLRAGGGIKENDGGDNLTKIYCMHLCKCHKVPQYNYNTLINKQKKKLIYDLQGGCKDHIG
jgi:hypothetical protein